MIYMMKATTITGREVLINMHHCVTAEINRERNTTVLEMTTGKKITVVGTDIENCMAIEHVSDMDGGCYL